MTQHIPAVSASKIEADRRILELLAQTFPDISAASTEIINLEAIMNLPKGTEHFVADLHGEHEAFRHLLKNASGNIKRKVTELFGTTMRESEIRRLCALIYYPAEKLQAIKSVEEEQDLEDFYTITLHQLVKVCQTVSSKYTRSKVRKALPKEFAYIIEELLHESSSEYDKVAYFNRIIETIISTGQAENFIIALCNVIQRLSIDQLHILGDIFDRGPGAHIILDTLRDYGSWDIQWGNHDVLWMGAAAGNDCCIANVIRISLRYANLTTLEEGYGINLLPLATFAMETYKDDHCDVFMPSTSGEANHTEKTLRLMARMHKAIAVIQFKLEGAMIEAHPEWNMGGRRLLDKMDLEAGTVEIEGKIYPMTDSTFPTIDPKNPYELTYEERHMFKKLHHSFTVSTSLRRHVDSLFSHGCMYGVYNSNLLFHASMPLNEDGSLREVELMGKKLKGKELMSGIGMVLRSAFNDDTPADEKEYARDYYWYLWCGPDSPLFDKDKMTTFERYFVEDPDARKEEKGWYYKLRDDEKVIDMILDEFGVEGDQRHIINGHVPVRTGKGESPIRAGGKLMVIDGGFAKAYHKTTGIAGYTLIYHSSNFELVEHEPFTSVEDAINQGTDIVRSNKMVEQTAKRICVRDTDKGRVLQGQIDELSELLYAFRHGIIKERGTRQSR